MYCHGTAFLVAVAYCHQLRVESQDTHKELEALREEIRNLTKEIKYVYAETFCCVCVNRGRALLLSQTKITTKWHPLCTMFSRSAYQIVVGYVQILSNNVLVSYFRYDGLCNANPLVSSLCCTVNGVFCLLDS